VIKEKKNYFLSIPDYKVSIKVALNQIVYVLNKKVDCSIIITVQSYPETAKKKYIYIYNSTNTYINTSTFL
jgi:hypothetical protein